MKTNDKLILKEYSIIIDTNSYSGNFERELCAYVTGQWDNETHGETQAEQFLEEYPDDPFDEIVEYRIIEHDGCGIISPQQITEDENGSLNSVEIFFYKKPTKEMIKIIMKRALKFESEGKIFDQPVDFKIMGFRLKETIVEEDNVSHSFKRM